MKLTLPYPPSINHYWRQGRGHTYISKEGSAFRRQVLASALGTALNPITGRVGITVDVYPPDNRRRDLDNVLKALLDALQHAGAYQDDSQIDSILVKRVDVVSGGAVEVELSEIQDDE